MAAIITSSNYIYIYIYIVMIVHERGAPPASSGSDWRGTWDDSRRRRAIVWIDFHWHFPGSVLHPPGRSAGNYEPTVLIGAIYLSR